MARQKTQALSPFPDFLTRPIAVICRIKHIFVFQTALEKSHVFPRYIITQNRRNATNFPTVEKNVSENLQSVPTHFSILLPPLRPSPALRSTGKPRRVQNRPRCSRRQTGCNPHRERRQRLLPVKGLHKTQRKILLFVFYVCSREINSFLSKAVSPLSCKTLWPYSLNLEFIEKLRNREIGGFSQTTDERKAKMDIFPDSQTFLPIHRRCLLKNRIFLFNFT